MSEHMFGFGKKKIKNETVLDSSNVSPELLSALSMGSDMNLSAVYKCVGLISDTIAKIPFYPYSESTSDKLSTGRYGGLLTLLNLKPNSYQNSYWFKRELLTMWILDGQVFIYPLWKTNIPYELNIIRKDRCSILVNEFTGQVIYNVNFRGKMLRLLPDELIDLKSFTLDGYNGISVLENARNSTIIGKLQDASQKSFYERSARPNGTITANSQIGDSPIEVKDSNGNVIKDSNGNPITISPKDAIRRAWDRQLATGSGTAVLDSGMTYKEINPLSPKDMDFVTNKELTIADIARFFKVPLSKLGVGTHTYNSVEQEEKEYINEAVEPYAEQLAQELTYKLLLTSDLASGIKIDYDDDDETMVDAVSRANYYQILEHSGALTPNEIRKREGLGKPLPDGDKPVIGPNLLPLGSQGK